MPFRNVVLNVICVSVFFSARNLFLNSLNVKKKNEQSFSFWSRFNFNDSSLAYHPRLIFNVQLKELTVFGIFAALFFGSFFYRIEWIFGIGTFDSSENYERNYYYYYSEFNSFSSWYSFRICVLMAHIFWILSTFNAIIIMVNIYREFWYRIRILLSDFSSAIQLLPEWRESERLAWG